MPLERERILAHEQPLVTLEAEHAIAGGDAHQPGVGRHAHDRGIEVHARLRVPAGIECRCQRQAMVADRDGRDPVGRSGRQGLEGAYAHAG